MYKIKNKSKLQKIQNKLKEYPASQTYLATAIGAIVFFKIVGPFQ
jgi:hypothetical protein